MFKKWIIRIRDGRDHLTASAVINTLMCKQCNVLQHCM